MHFHFKNHVFNIKNKYIKCIKCIKIYKDTRKRKHRITNVSRKVER
jgi:hypothetical protein